MSKFNTCARITMIIALEIIIGAIVLIIGG